MAAADGYAELGLSELAWEELDGLTHSDRLRPDVRELTLGLLVRQKRWGEAIEEGRQLCAAGGDRPAVFIHTAFALHESGRTAEAQTTLLKGPPSLRNDPLYHYNLACYLAVAGNLKEAEICLRTAFKMDAKLRLHARNDPDLREFREVI